MYFGYVGKHRQKKECQVDFFEVGWRKIWRKEEKIYEKSYSVV